MDEGNPEGPGPEWYQRIRAHTSRDARRLLEHALGRPVLRVRKDKTGASHAVYFAMLAGGLECVLRVVMHANEDAGLEAWLVERCRARGVPAPDTLALQPQAQDGFPPYVISRRLPGRNGYRVRLPSAGRSAVLREMGRYLAAIHALPVEGFGFLRQLGSTYAGTEPSLWSFIDHEIAGELAQLPDTALSESRRKAIYARFAAARDLLDLPVAVTCHGDYRLKNALLDREPSSVRWRVSGIVDFEMAHAGDPASDLGYFFYSLRDRPRGEADLAAICEGYGVPYPLPPGLRERVILYEILAAVSHLWWETSFKDADGIRRALAALDELEGALN